MKLTLEILFNDPNVVKAVIDRTTALQEDEIFWKRYLDFEETKSRIFKAYLGTVTGVTAGSIIDRNSNKPLRERKSLGSGYGEVAYLGDRYQMDNDRLDMIKSLIDKFNSARTSEQAAAMNAIINYIYDDIRQLRLAPHKRMDLVVGDLRSDGRASVTLAHYPGYIRQGQLYHLPEKSDRGFAADNGPVLRNGDVAFYLQQEHCRRQGIRQHLQDDSRWRTDGSFGRSHH